MPFEFVCSHWPSVLCTSASYLLCPCAELLDSFKWDRETLLAHFKVKQISKWGNKREIEALTTHFKIILMSAMQSSSFELDLCEMQCSLLAISKPKTTVFNANLKLCPHLQYFFYCTPSLPNFCKLVTCHELCVTEKEMQPVTSSLTMATDATRKAILYLCICLPNGLCVGVTRSVKTPLNDILDPPL